MEFINWRRKYDDLDERYNELQKRYDELLKVKKNKPTLRIDVFKHDEEDYSTIVSINGEVKGSVEHISFQIHGDKPLVTLGMSDGAYYRGDVGFVTDMLVGI